MGKSYFVAIEVTFNCEKNGETVGGSITTLRPIRRSESGNYVQRQEIKGYLQDSGNEVDIVKLEDKSVSVKARISLYEGELSDYTTGQSNVKVADYIGQDGIYALYDGLPVGQTEDKWSTYTESQIKGEVHI